MRRLAPSLAFVLLACGAASADTHTSTGTLVTPIDFSVETWPGEGIPVFEARRVYLFLHEAPDVAAAVVDTLITYLGARVHFDSTRYQTIHPGAITVQRPATVSGRDFGERGHLTYDEYYSGDHERTDIRVSPPETIAFLQHRAEGTCFVRLEKRVINADPCPVFDATTVHVEREPDVRWWIRTRGQHGLSGGVEVTDSTVRTTRREF